MLFMIGLYKYYENEMVELKLRAGLVRRTHTPLRLVFINGLFDNVYVNQLRSDLHKHYQDLRQHLALLSYQPTNLAIP